MKQRIKTISVEFFLKFWNIIWFKNELDTLTIIYILTLRNCTTYFKLNLWQKKVSSFIFFYNNYNIKLKLNLHFSLLYIASSSIKFKY